MKATKNSSLSSLKESLLESSWSLEAAQQGPDQLLNPVDTLVGQRLFLSVLGSSELRVGRPGAVVTLSFITHRLLKYTSHLLM